MDNVERVAATDEESGTADYAPNLDILVSEDPIFARILSLDVLTHDEQLQWISRVKWLLMRRKEGLRRTRPAGDCGDLVVAASVEIIDVHLKYLSELRARVGREGHALQ